MRFAVYGKVLGLRATICDAGVIFSGRCGRTRRSDKDLLSKVRVAKHFIHIILKGLIWIIFAFDSCTFQLIQMQFCFGSILLSNFRLELRLCIAIIVKIKLFAFASLIVTIMVVVSISVFAAFLHSYRKWSTTPGGDGVIHNPTFRQKLMH